MPNLPLKNNKRPWIKSNIPEGKRQTVKDNLFYHGKTWKAVRDYQLMIEPLCRECKKNNRIVAATTVDHIVSIKKDGLMYDPRNLQSLCNRCHAKKSGKEAHG